MRWLCVRQFSALLQKNELIKADKILVVDENGARLGVMLLREALDKLVTPTTDLVLVASSTSPPVCKLLSKLAQKQLVEKEKETFTKQRLQSKEKEVYFGTSVSEHDLRIKIKKLSEFMEKGYRSKVVIEPKGPAHFAENAREQLKERIISQVGTLATCTSAPSAGSNLVFYLSSKPNK
jgi:translation initiation factor IF-3